MAMQQRIRAHVEPLLYSRDDACRILGISLSTLKLLIGKRSILEIGIGKRRMIPRSEIDRVIADAEVQASQDR